MKDLKIQTDETIHDWLKRLNRHFSQNKSKLGSEILKVIEEKVNIEFTEKDAIKIRQGLIELINDLFDAPGELQGISFEEISSLELIFFPVGYNSNISCQYCLREKSKCIC